MARTHFVVANKLLEKTAATKRTRQIVLLIGVPLTFVSLLFNGWIAVAIGVITGLIFAFTSSDPVMAAGAEGEEQAMHLRRGLPNTFTIFNQLDIPNARSSTGVNEADFVVCGPNAVFVIEVKHNNGAVVCDEQAQQWQVSKVGAKGNCIPEADAQPDRTDQEPCLAAGRAFEEGERQPWIQGIVLFTNPSVNLTLLGTPSVPILRPDELLQYMQSFQKDARPDVLVRAAGVIEGLRGMLVQQAA